MVPWPLPFSPTTRTPLSSSNSSGSISSSCSDGSSSTRPKEVSRFVNILFLIFLIAIRENGHITISWPYGIFIVFFNEFRRPHNFNYYHKIFKTNGSCHPPWPIPKGSYYSGATVYGIPLPSYVQFDFEIRKRNNSLLEYHCEFIVLCPYVIQLFTVTWNK